jgi:hypothetical protein
MDLDVATGRQYQPCVNFIVREVEMSPSDLIEVAVLLDNGATIIDFAGPWDAFMDATDEQAGFHVFAVAPTKGPIQTMGGLTLVPDYTFADAPQPKVIVIPAQGGGKDPAKLEWIRSAARASHRILPRFLSPASTTRVVDVSDGGWGTPRSKWAMVVLCFDDSRRRSRRARPEAASLDGTHGPAG